MTDRLRFRLVHAKARELAGEAIRNAPDGWHVEVKAPTRTLEQNAKLHAMIDDVVAQVEWYGKKRDKEAWKQLFLTELESYELVPGLSGTFVPIRRSTADLTIAEMSDIMMLIEAFGAAHNVVFGGE